MGREETIQYDAPGWAAIDNALAQIYGDAEPHRWRAEVKWRDRGPDPLDGISVYARTEPVPHWHFVSYGMSELYDKRSRNPEWSGWGYEFTFRLARAADETTPPEWAMTMLQDLGWHTCRTGHQFEPGQIMTVNGPHAAEDPAVQPIAFTRDPELGTIATPHGYVRFLQVVGLTTDEHRAASLWNTERLLETLAPRIPLYVSDIERASLLDDPETAAAVAAGSERDGSSTGWVGVSLVEWELESDSTVLRLDARRATAIADVLPGRLPHSEPLVVQSGDHAVLFVAVTQFRRPALMQDTLLEVGVPGGPAMRELIAALRTQEGTHAFTEMPGLVLELCPPDPKA
ncbi:suppressor of fused domain protein [Nocardia sp. 2]|uniref:Suppressor of fused domain protein n=1 Tax=Nocardia acididurans TaxID=2802282 RepID=A0ABS1MAN2_9NOCA|nr:suppressor of fused domain protein [Nocardia acididurans]MBL1077683.1 suppressor of fused domain protein [Nocardia acididurans]